MVDVCAGIAECTHGMKDAKVTYENGDIKISGCGYAHANYRRIGLDVFACNRTTGERESISAEQVHEIFAKITDEDVLALGLDPLYSRPDWMIVTLLPVPPPHVRPPVAMAAGEAQDDLTTKLGEILKANVKLKRARDNGSPPNTIAELVRVLQYHVATYVDNEQPGTVPKAKVKSGKPIKSIRQRLKGKEGRVRGNMMGKRVDFSARSVITPDPNLSINQLGVPRTIAMNLTYPERVTAYNIERMHTLVRRGASQHPGAKYVIRSNGERVDVKLFSGERAGEARLEYGDIVERHIDDGDPVLFNRQPSLHKMSIMGHLVKVMPWSTFRLNLTCTTPYNADFDGDEMNMHVPQSLETRAEILEIMMVPRQIVSPQHNKPVMGIVQDTLLGSDKFSRRDVFLEKYMVMNLCMWLPNFSGRLPCPAILKPVPLWTGKQILSLIMPKVNLIRKHSTHPDSESGDAEDHSVGDTKVRIEQGELLTGILCGKTLGRNPGSLIHVAWTELGHEVTRNFIDSCQKIVNYFLLHRGFSIGVADTIPEKRVQDIKVEKIRHAKEQVNVLQGQAQTKDGLELMPGRTYQEVFEHKVNDVLNKARDHVGESAQESLDSRTSNVRSMVTAGSKGSFLNISQMMGCVGQQNVEGKRIQFGFRRRTLPHFCKDDHGPESRGFVENSYYQGLNPQEFFFHAMGGREGLSDTAVKTADTGYIQRKLVKAMEDVSVQYDGTVRRATGDVVQFLYGEDAIDGCFVEEQPFESFTISNEKFKDMYFMDTEAGNFGQGYLTPDIADRVRSSTEILAAIEEEFEQLQRDREELRKFIFKDTRKNSWHLPVNLRRLIWNARKANYVDESKPSGMSPEVVIYGVRKLLENDINVVYGTDPVSREAQENGTLLFKILVRSTLSAKQVLKVHRLNHTAFTWLLGEIRHRFHSAICHPGEMIGAIAAQSIGEPATQMTLNTFHNAGISSKRAATAGVPRLRELMAAGKVAAPSFEIYLTEQYSGDMDMAKRIFNKVEYVNLGSVSLNSEIYYDPDPKNPIVDTDKVLFRDFYQGLDSVDVNNERVPFENLSRWVLRIELDRPSLVGKDLDMRAIADRIEEIYTGWIHVAYTESMASSLVLRLRLVHKSPQDDTKSAEGESVIPDNEWLNKVEAELMSKTHLIGVQGVKKAFIESTNRAVINEIGEIVSKKETYLEAEGVKDSATDVTLKEVLALEGVDNTRIMSNNPKDMLNVFGIECARAVLFKSFRQIIESASAINVRHLILLCDSMTARGQIMAVSRHGVNRSDSSVLLRASFEETVDILLDAAAFAERDPLKGVSPAIMLGKIANVGTGEFDLYLDEVALERAIDVVRTYPDMRGDMPGSPMTGMAGTPMGDNTPMYTAYSDSPIGPFSPSVDSPRSPGGYGGASGYMDTPQYTPTGLYQDGHAGGAWGANAGPAYSPSSPRQAPGRSPASPLYSPADGAKYSPTSPRHEPSSPKYSPSSPVYGHGMSPASPSYSPSSPNYSPSSPRVAGYSPASPSYSPSSPRVAGYSPASPTYSPSSPRAAGYSPASPSYSPSSPQYSPSSPRAAGYSPASPSYSPSSPAGPGGMRHSPASPQYSPSSPQYSPASPKYSPSSPQYSPSSPQYSPSSPQYSPSSPQYSPSSPSYSPSSPSYSPSSPRQPPPPQQKK